MKKKMIFAAIAAVAVISGYMGYSLFGKPQAPSALALVNIEALSGDDENPEGWTSVTRNHLEIIDHGTYLREILTVITDCIEGGEEKDCSPNLEVYLKDIPK